MDGVRPPRCVEWRWRVLLLSCTAQCGGVARALLIPLQCWLVLQLMSCTVSCRVCGVWVVSVCPWCSCGGVSSVRSPLVVVEGGAVADGGWL